MSTLPAVHAQRSSRRAQDGPRVALHTLGCRLNQSETAMLAAGFRRRGFRIVPFGEHADLVVFNACSVTAEAEAECRRLVRSVRRRAPEAWIAVTGCYAQVAGKTLQALPGVDLVVGNADKHRLPELVPASWPQPKRDAAVWVHHKPGRRTFRHPDVGLHAGQTRANLKIQDGCDVGCSFCIIPQTRGRARSRAFDDVVGEARELVARGHRELVITGVNLGTYRDGDRDFVALLDALDAVDGLWRLRISSIEPSTVTEPLLRRMAASPRICRHLHVPIQSADDDVLRRMRRPYRRDDLEALFAGIRRHLPGVALGTDVMVGFPGETPAAFQASVNLITAVEFAYLHVFRWSPRPGTGANRQTERVPDAEVRRRSRTLRELDARLRRAFGEHHLGREVEVLVEQPLPGGDAVGLTDTYLRVRFHAGDAGAAELTNQRCRVRLAAPEGRLWRGHVSTAGATTPPESARRGSMPGVRATSDSGKDPT